MNETIPIIQVRGATVRSGGETMVEDLTFRVQRGQHTAILGPNGAGKSTLLELLTYRRRPYAGKEGRGTVRVFGREHWDVFELRSHLGVVSEELHDRFLRRSQRLTGFEAVASGYFSSPRIPVGRELDEEIREASRAALDRLSVGHLAEKKVGTMSNGELRRILIARALAPEPDALLLDEPTTGLDLAGRRRLAELLRELARGDTTIVLATHHVEEIFPEIGRVMLLREGRIAADGPKPHLLTGERLSPLYDAQVSVTAQPDGYFQARVDSMHSSTNTHPHG